MIYKTKYLDDRLLNPSGYVNQPISFHPYRTYIENKDNKNRHSAYLSTPEDLQTCVFHLSRQWSEMQSIRRLH